MDKKEARRIVLRIATYGNIVISQGHPARRKAQRHFTTQDALRVLHGGAMVKDIKDHDEGFECVMQGPIDDGRVLRVPVLVNPEKNEIIVKSFVWVRRRKS